MAASVKLLALRRGSLPLRKAASFQQWMSISIQDFFTSCSSPYDAHFGCSHRGLEAFAFFPHRSFSRKFSSGGSSSVKHEIEGPAAIDYSSLLQEEEYHKLADYTVHDLLEKLEEYGDSLDVDGFDIDYGNEVLTLKLGDVGTYVINKQTPNRQIWMSSPVSGPSRFDWDLQNQAWIYRRTKANLFKVLEDELEELLGQRPSLQ